MIEIVRPAKLPSQAMISACAVRHALHVVGPLAGGLERGLDRLGARVHREDHLVAGQLAELAVVRARAGRCGRPGW